MTTPQPLDRHAFEAWLDTKKPDEIVGVTGNACRCPVATWQQWETGMSVTVEAYVVMWRRGRHESTIVPPEWLGQFVHDIDELGAPETNVTASQALDVLRRIP